MGSISFFTVSPRSGNGLQQRPRERERHLQPQLGGGAEVVGERCGMASWKKLERIEDEVLLLQRIFKNSKKKIKKKRKRR